MANEQNLIPVTMRSPREQKEISSKGGKASAIKKKQNKTFQELAQMMLNSKLQDKNIIKKIKEICPDIDIKDITNRSALLISQIEKAVVLKDTKAFEVIRDTSGEKPVDRIEEESKIDIKINWGK